MIAPAQSLRRIRRLLRLAVILLLGASAYFAATTREAQRFYLSHIRNYHGCTCDDCLRAFSGYTTSFTNEVRLPGGRWADRWDLAIRLGTCAALLAAAAAIGPERIARRVFGRRPEGHCTSCGYNLSGLGPGSRCPECGHA